MNRPENNIQKVLEANKLRTPQQVFGPAGTDSLVGTPPLPLDAKAIMATYGSRGILPIEFFKWYANELRLLLPHPAVRTFLSSGTSQVDRSQSHFSEAGLHSYRHLSLASFHAVLRNFYQEPMQVPGISLVPRVEEWPDSSLAQMLGWIGAEYQLQYWNGREPIPNQPLWIFGTAFHFVNLADDGVRIELPKGSIVIETGGTKGRSRAVTREELYHLIEEHLGVPQNQIVSEYGMCELASQAYDFVENPNQPQVQLANRWFRFPSWSPISVMNRLSHLQSSGEGTLLIHDQARFDYPWPIRTEDMARVRSDGAFQLLGRVPMSPLKGCSMLAESIRNHIIQPKRPHAPRKLSDVPLDFRAQLVHEIAQNLLQDETFWHLWLTEMGSSQAVVWLREDFATSLPKSSTEWLNAAKVARGKSCPARYLIIPPESHSYAWLYPVLLGTVLGIKLFVRAKTQDKLILFIQEKLKSLGGLELWDSINRIGADPLPEVDALLVYGADDTIKQLQAKTALPLQGFGSYLTISVLDINELASHRQRLWKDAWSLMQKGCMSSRSCFIVVDDRPTDDALLHEFLQGASPLGNLPLGIELALEHGAFARRCQNLETPLRSREGAPLLVIQDFDKSKTLADNLLDRAISLSLVMVPRQLWPEFQDWLAQQQNLRKIACNLNTESRFRFDSTRFELTQHGSANAPAWNGLHQKRPLFAL